MTTKREIKNFIEVQNSLDTLSFITCGSVDDGKSTLLGRMLFEAQLIFDDQIDNLIKDSKKIGTQGQDIDFALLVDGLAAEREQGITIDVAYRFFSTKKRKFIVADSPGHEQYTRNMVTAASNTDLAIILIDARNGMLAQTRRHSYIANLMGIKEIIVAVNKMDLVGYGQKNFEDLKREYEENIACNLDFDCVYYIPISALEGDNILKPSKNMKWYKGPQLMKMLEEVQISKTKKSFFSLPIQYVNRPSLDFRGFCGTVSSGELKKGDEIKVSGSNQYAKIAGIFIGDKEVAKCRHKDSVTITLNKEIDISRGDIVTKSDSEIDTATAYLAKIVWLSSDHGYANRSYILKTAHSQRNCEIIKIKNRIDINNFTKTQTNRIDMNDIAECEINLDQESTMQPFKSNEILGNFILIDKVSNLTVAAGVVSHSLRRSTNVKWQNTDINSKMRQKIIGQKPIVLWFTGLSGAGKSTIANLLEKKLFSMGKLTYLLDGDNLRHGLNKDLGFKVEDRIENVRRVGELCRILHDAGIIVLASFISPFRADREKIRDMFPDGDFVEIYVQASIPSLTKRDPKGLYAKAIKGEIPNFTGINSAYEEPHNPDLIINTDKVSAEAAVEEIISYIGN